MPLSILIIGVLIIFYFCDIGKENFKKITQSNFFYLVFFGALFLTLMLKPIVLWDKIYINIGGALISLVCLYALIKDKNKKQIFNAFEVFFITTLIFQLVTPFIENDLFTKSILIIGALAGFVLFYSNFSLKTATVTIFLGYPILQIIWFLLKQTYISYEILLIGTGNLFEASVISFATLFVLNSLKTSFLKTQVKYKKYKFKNKKEISYE